MQPPPPPSSSPTVTVAHGPLQAFGQVHRALKDNEKRLASLASESASIESVREVDSKVGAITRRFASDGRALRAETHSLLADLEELVMSMYEEHEAALRQASQQGVRGWWQKRAL